MTSLYSQRRLSALIKGETPTVRHDGDKRNQFETDFDRILFSAPIRRLADKTQVFPQEIDDFLSINVVDVNFANAIV